MTASPFLSINFPNNGGINKVANIAALQALLSSGLVTGQNMIVDGLVSMGDGKGGVFVYDAANLSAVDGETVIAPTDVGPMAGRWLKVDAIAENISYGRYGFATVTDAIDALLNMWRAP